MIEVNSVSPATTSGRVLPAPLRSSRFNCVLGLALVGLLLVLFQRVSGFYPAASVTLSFVVFTLPGHFLFPLLTGTRPFAGFEHAVWSTILGFVTSSLLALIVGFCGGWGLIPVAATLLLFSLVSFAALTLRPEVKRPRLAVAPWTSIDYTLLLSSSVLTLSAVFLPFSRVGEVTPKGVAFPSLFGLDFILRVSYAAAISQGIPPEYLNYSGLNLQTYWLFYVLPGFVHMATGYRFSLQGIFIVTELLQILMFLGAAFSVIRVFVKGQAAAALTMFLLICAYSYYGYFALLKTTLVGMAWSLTGFLRSTGVFNQFSLLSHSYFRNYLVEPQALGAICVVLLLLRLVASGDRNLWDARFSIVAGALAGCAFGIDATIGLICIAWCVALLVVDIKERRQAWPLAAYVIMVTAVAALFGAIGMYSYGAGSSGIQLRPYARVMLAAPAYFLLDYGPMAVFGTWFFVSRRRQYLAGELLPVLGLAAVSLIFVCFFRHSFETNLGLRKGIMTLQIPLLVSAGLFMEDVYLQPRARPFVRKAVPLLIAAGVPTLFVDIYSASSLTNEHNTTFVNPLDYEACQWLKHETERGAVVQSEPEYPSVYEYSLISSFAERTMVVGQSSLSRTLHIPDGQAFSERRRADIRSMFATEDVKGSLAVIRRYGIDYVYVGSLEKHLYSSGIEKFGRETGIFRKVFSNREVDIYRVSLERGQ